MTEIHSKHTERTERGALPCPRRPSSRSIAVLLAGKLTAMEAPGGGEIQMLALARMLPSSSVEARLWRPWEETLAGADCLHLFGSLPEHLPVVEAARRRNVPVVLSTITWFDLANCLREPGPILRRLAACTKFLIRAACPQLPSWRRRLYHAADLLLPNSNAEAQQLVRYFGVPLERIQIVQNGADCRFARADAEPFARRVGTRDFVLYPGRIEPRKNQLGFLKAMRGAGVPIVILGDAVPGYGWYLAKCREVADHHVRFVPRIDHDDPLMASAYAACGCLALASWFETPGLVALEAGMSGTPLVLPEGGSAGEYFGPLAAYVKPNDPSGIRRAVLAALARGRSEQLARIVRENYSWQAAAQVTREAYEKVIRNRNATV
ncbi:MAG TPA: glycosyltransferase [Thermoguttaceae bacterium]|nr:glycosyltransferase [Thermoguttaceae bacterium]